MDICSVKTKRRMPAHANTNRYKTRKNISNQSGTFEFLACVALGSNILQILKHSISFIAIEKTFVYFSWFYKLRCFRVKPMLAFVRRHYAWPIPHIDLRTLRFALNLSLFNKLYIGSSTTYFYAKARLRKLLWELVQL